MRDCWPVWFVVGSLLVAGSTVSACRRPAAPPPSHDRPNVLLMTLDTTRADRLGCYGYEGDTSLNLDALAREGVLFERAICSAAVTPVSHASILTGLHPYTHGLRVLHGRAENRLPEANVTLAEVLKEAGYDTAAFISAFPAGSHFGLAQGFDVFNEGFLHEDVEAIVSQAGDVNTGANQRHAGETTDLALAWLAGRESGRPYFLWLHYFDPHDPRLLPPPEYFNQFPVPEGSVEDKLRAVYDIEVRYMDEQIGRVFAALRAAGELDRTVVAIVSDHGEGLGDHDWWTHGILYEEQIWAPMILRAPDGPAGIRVPHLVRTIDLMPTIIDLARLPVRHVPAMDGASLTPLLAGAAPDPGYTAYADSVNMLTYRFAKGIEDVKNDMLFCVIDWPWKYIHHLKRPAESELYNLADDPRELNNLYATDPDQVQRLMKDLKSRDFLPEMKAGVHNLSAEEIERLRSLGYIGDE